MSNTIDSESEDSTKTTERRLFIILTVFLAPILAIAVVGALGFSIWIYQIFNGPPGI